MKVCILTQPLGHNYGGVMQNYALQTVLKRMGHDVWTENRKHNKKNFLDKIKEINLIRLLFGKNKNNCSVAKQLAIEKYTQKFIEEYIKVTIPIYSSQKKKLIKYGFDAYIVGSDQVWRPSYSLGIYNYFLDFTRKLDVKRIAYAASFGINKWEFSNKETIRCRRLLKVFDAVSVREDSAVTLCQNKLSVNAKLSLDPTFLIDREDYLSLVDNDLTLPSLKDDNNLLVYVLDNSTEKEKIIKFLNSVIKLRINRILPSSDNVLKESDSSFMFSSIPLWIRNFQHSKYVITDSFHGTIFAIIFNKPFITIANKNRGLTRFISLLKLLDLEDRLIFSPEEIDDKIINSRIDYSIVNSKLKALKADSIDFLFEALSNN